MNGAARVSGGGGRGKGRWSSKGALGSNGPYEVEVNLFLFAVVVWHLLEGFGLRCGSFA